MHSPHPTCIYVHVYTHSCTSRGIAGRVTIMDVLELALRFLLLFYSLAVAAFAVVGQTMLTQNGTGE